MRSGPPLGELDIESESDCDTERGIFRAIISSVKISSGPMDQKPDLMVLEHRQAPRRASALPDFAGVTKERPSEVRKWLLALPRRQRSSSAVGVHGRGESLADPVLVSLAAPTQSRHNSSCVIGNEFGPAQLASTPASPLEAHPFPWDTIRPARASMSAPQDGHPYSQSPQSSVFPPHPNAYDPARISRRKTGCDGLEHVAELTSKKCH